MTTEYLIVLRIVCDDDTEDPRQWPYDDLLQPPPGELGRHVKYVDGVKVDR